MDQTESPTPATDAQPPAPWQRLMEGQSFLIELHQLYDARFMLELEMLIGPKAGVDDLRKGVEAAARAYIRERRKMRRRKPVVMEYRRLWALSDKLEAVLGELSRIQASPNCSGKLAEALEARAQTAESSAAKIANMIDGAFGPGDPITHIAGFLDLLQKSAAQTLHLNEDDTLKCYHEADLNRWQNRPKKTESQPIFALARAFRPYWDRNAMRPYNAGRYDKTTKQNKAIAIDVIHLIAQKLDPDLPRARVVTVMREI
jgi:hypothetical protein